MTSWTLTCPHCSSGASMSRQTRTIWCNKCGQKRTPSFKCPSCIYELCSQCRKDFEAEENRKAQREHEERMVKEEQERQRIENLAKQADRAHEAKMKKLEQEEADRADQRKAAEDARKLEHKQVLHQLELDKIAKEKEKEAQEQKHQEDLKNMEIQSKKENVENQKKQRDENLARLEKAIVEFEKQDKAYEKDLANMKEELKTTTEVIAAKDRQITGFDKKGKLKEERKTMDATEKKYKRDDDEILATIKKTGQNEDSIGRFLTLTHRLIGDTVSTQEEANKLNAELSTFGTMIGRECQDKLSIEYYFGDKQLTRFIPILSSNSYHEMQQLECKDDDEFDEIIEMIDDGINKQISEWNKKHGEDDDNDEENLEILLKKFGLKKYITPLKKSGLTGLSDLEDIPDDDVDSFIEDANMSKMWGKKLKKAVKSFNSGKWKPPKREDDEKTEEKIEKKQEVNDENATTPEPTDITKGEKRQLKEIALNAEEVWKLFEKEKADGTKSAMTQMCPLLADFFDKMFHGVKRAQQLLSYNEELNNDQQQAIVMLMQSTVKPKAIKAAQNSSTKIVEIDEKDDEKKPVVNEVDDDDEVDDEKKEDINTETLLPDYEQRKAWKKNSECQVYSKSTKCWHDGSVLEVEHDKEGEWLNVSYEVDNKKTQLVQIGRFSDQVRDKLVMSTSAINAAAVVSVSVKNLMLQRFSQSSTTKRALATATGVEESCKQIIKCQAQIRQSVMLAGSILKLKPGNLTKEAVPMWDAVDKGVIRILKSALEMSKITSEYFSFFLRFNQSFNRFVSMYNENKNISLLVSMEHVKQDISDFTKFKENFNKQVELLSEEAMNVITNCVETHIGADNWKLTRQARAKSLTLYLDAKEKYDTKSLQLEKNLEKLMKERAESRAKEAKLTYKEKNLKDSIKRNKKFIKDYRKIKVKLNQMVFGNND